MNSESKKKPAEKLSAFLLKNLTGAHFKADIIMALHAGQPCERKWMIVLGCTVALEFDKRTHNCAESLLY